MKRRQMQRRCPVCGVPAIHAGLDGLVHAEGSACLKDCPTCGVTMTFDAGMDLFTHPESDPPLLHFLPALRRCSMRELAFICPACKQETPTQITRWAAHINVTTGETWRETCAHCGVEYQFDLRAKAVPNLFELLSKPAANGGAT